MSLYEGITVLATSDEQAEAMARRAEDDGFTVQRSVVWEGPVPPLSFVEIGDGMCMSTPEYFFFRMCSTRPIDEAVAIGDELCGRYRTHLTTPSLEPRVVEPCPQRCSVGGIFAYLLPVLHTPEGGRAAEVLSRVTEGRARP